LTKDINDLASSSPVVHSSYVYTPKSQFPVAGDVAFFSAEDGIHGIELWRTDGTPAGTYIVKDINPGESSTLMVNMVAVNGKIYFSASRDGFNFYPWVSDGTASGTFAIDSTQQGRASFPQRFAGLNDAVYMSSSGSGLFDGSGFDFGGLAKVNDDLHGFTFLNVLKNAGYSGVSELTEADGLLFFTASAFTTTQQVLALWRTDGTEAGTYKLTDLKQPDGTPLRRGVTSYLTAYNNKLYFLFADETGFKLGVSDGTITGTGLAPGNNGITIPPGNSYEYQFPVMNNVLFLQGNNQAGQNGLYKYDAANPNGLVLVKDIFPDVDDELISIGFEVGNNILYFVVANYQTATQELWRSDGTEAGTTRIISSQSYGRFISPLHFYLGNLYFVVQDALHGSEIWKSDGTANGTTIIKDINPGPDNSVSIALTEVNGKVIFIANEIKTNTGIELWATNGTAPGTKLLKDINKTKTDDSSPMDGSPAASLKDQIVFAAFENVHGRELYISDGTKKGTRLLNDITSGKSGSSPGYFYAKNDEVYFVAYPNDFNHPTIYRTNGKPQGLKKIATYYKDVNDQTILKVTDKGLVFFIVRNQVSHNNELWRSNGSLSGTIKIADKLASELIETVGNTVYFMAGDFANGTKLWKSDGSIAGTKEFWNTPAFTYRMFAFRDRLYFVTVDANTTLWKTNGTTNGTVRLTDIPGPFSFVLSMISGETLYFTTFSNETFIQHLWKTNGTVAGTTELQRPFSSIYELGDVNGDLFFWGSSAEEPNAAKLWKITCRSSSIELVKDFSNNPIETFPGGSASAGDKYFFVVRGDLVPGTDFYSQILWSSDGTASGTEPINDPLLSSLRFRSRLIGADDNLFFAAESYQYGNELYVGRISRKHKDRNFEHVNVAKPGDNILEKDASANDNLKIFPNPTTNTITVFFQQQQVNDLIITINDQAGRVMIRKKLSTQKGANSVSFNVESLPAGTYIIQFSDRKELVSKFVKE
jgi:ELWxxDGT repeat protein